MARRLFRRALGLAALFAALRRPVLAGSDLWRSLGPHSVEPAVLRVDPHGGAVYVGTDAGLFRSPDRGATWGRVPGITGAVHAIAFDPFAAGTLFVTESFGLLLGPVRPDRVQRTRDSGATWTPVLEDDGASLGFSLAPAIVCDPHAPATVYVKEGDSPFEDSRIFKSGDGGATWRALPFRLSGFAPLIADPARASTLYVLGRAGALVTVFKSADAGETWNRADDGLEGDIEEIAILGSSPPALLARGTRLFRSTDGAGSWNEVRSVRVHTLVADPASPAAYGLEEGSFAVLRSSDGGSSWSRVPFSAGLMTPLMVEPGAGDALWASDATQGGRLPRLFASSDGGRSWLDRTGDLSDVGVRSVTLAPGIAGRLFVATGRGLYGSSDGGENWTGATLPGGAPLFAESLAFDPSSGSTVYATFGSSVYKSADGGGSWAVLPDSPASDFEPAALLAVDGHSTVYLGVVGPVPVFRSTDGGASWSARGAGLPETSFADFRGLLVDPGSDSVLYAALRSQGVFKTSDAGITWVPSGLGLPDADVLALAIDPLASANLYASVSGHGVFRSRDGGATWTETGASPAGDTLTLSADPATPSVLLAGTDGAGVFRSLDGGSSWAPLGEGLEGQIVYGIVVDDAAATATVYAGTSQGAHAIAAAGAPPESPPRQPPAISGRQRPPARSVGPRG